MYTDALLIARLARELDQRFAGARVTDVGRLDDGRLAIALWKRGHASLVCVDPFAPTPLITVEQGELPIASEPGFVRAAGAALRGKTVEHVRARRGDRLVRFDFRSRSRFGVAETSALICELVPRFGNVVLLKGETIVAAMKEFSPSENTVRSIEAGAPYELPPRRSGPLSRLMPDELAAPLAEAIPDDPLYVYRKDGALLQAHMVPLPRFDGIEPERAASLLDVFAELRTHQSGAARSDRITKRRRDLSNALDKRERKLLAEIERAQASPGGPEALRESGERIFATLHELPEDARDEAKQQASEFFSRYRKARGAAAHAARRRAELQQALDDLAQLRWNLEAAADEDLDDIAAAIAHEPTTRRASARTTQRRRKPLSYMTPAGSRIFVGRTPLENADLTFRVARPDDLWFHVQNQPGSHVILQRDDRTPPPEDDVIAAASLAALHSKAKTSAKVTVDYTQRKHVRKRPAAAPGLVFYTRPRSVVVSPGSPPEPR